MTKAKSIRRRSTWLVAAVLPILLTSCEKGPQPVQGFVLPDGNVERGRQVFAETGCRYCHTVTNENFPPFDATPVLNIELGGKVLKVKNYGELLTSIVDPTHSVSIRYKMQMDPDERDTAESPMPDFNDVLKITDLIDLTAYLHSRYEEYGPEYRGYRYVR